VYIVPRLRPDRREEAILIGSGDEMKELILEVNNNSRYSLKFVSSIDINELDALDFENEILNKIYSENISTIVIDLKNEKVEPILPRLYNLIFGGVQFVDKYKIYEDIFDRVPLSLIGYNWFLENISNSSHITYDILKRIMDISIAFVFGVLSLIVYPFVYIAIKLDDGGAIFIHQDRVGRNNTTIKILKFRSMTNDDKGQYGDENINKVTKVGSFLRKTRIDELPQLWNVVSGKLSLIGPRPELPTLVKEYEEGIHYYAIRHLIKPGLSGWAQIYHDAHPHHGTDIKETKVKLSYDLYYLKNRSFLLDIKIAIKTVRTLLSRSGV
jgi:lipopolysaccharide/colanic/teichoic acid biosynthesis glycosyltransferase